MAKLKRSGAAYEVCNRGPWTTVEYKEWPDFSLGQTTALTGGAGADFRSGALADLLLAPFVGENYHQPEQVHGTRVAAVKKNSCCYRNVDGLLTSRPKQVLTVLTADCLPIFIKEADNSRWALVHAGWRGLTAGIVPRTLKKEFKGPVDVLAGAAISPESYKVGDEVVEAAASSLGMTVEDLVSLEVVQGGGEKYRLDLQALLHQQLQISPVCVNSLLCTPLSTDGDLIPLISYRCQKSKKRMLHWIYRE